MASRITTQCYIEWSIEPCEDADLIVVHCDLFGTHISRMMSLGVAKLARFDIVWPVCMEMQKEVLREYDASALAKGLREWPLWMLKREQSNVS